MLDVFRDSPDKKRVHFDPWQFTTDYNN
jgi:hypothetical protein